MTNPRNRGFPVIIGGRHKLMPLAAVNISVYKNILEAISVDLRDAEK
jgi:hypothetical protein